MRAIKSVGGLVVLFLATGMPTPAAVPAAATYSGSFRGFEDTSSVELRVVFKHGKPVKANFTGTGLGVVCEDDTFPTVEIPSLRLDFLDRTHFEGERYARSSEGDQTYYFVRGRLEGRRVAHGVIVYVADPWDPPTAPYQPDCQTAIDGYGWKATRT